MSTVKIMFASLGAYGHLYPMMPLALACAAAGNETVIAVGPPFLGRLPLPTVPGYPPELELDWAIQEARRRHPDLHDQEFSMAMFADVTAESVAPTMIKQCEQMPPDLVVYEGMDTGAGVAASALGIPAAAYAIALASFLYSPLHRSTVSCQRDLWLQRDRTPPEGTTLLAAALINPAPRGVRQVDGIAAPTIPIRSVAFSESSAGVPAYLSGFHTRPRVYLTLGTVSFGAVDVLSRAIAEIAPLGVDILVTVGPEGEPAALGDVPDNVHVERFVAQSAVLPLVDLIVHHGGTGTVLAALEVGLPQLLLPQGADQFFNAQILTDAGAARALANDAQEPGTIAEAVQALLGDSPEREAAARVRDEIAAMPSPADVVPVLVELAGL
jgi:Erythromycin biosynthesis protein CIII-like, C-terminal domain/Erythromycin biosynthesis protein CIII-like, N-terminal domain